MPADGADECGKICGVRGGGWGRKGDIVVVLSRCNAPPPSSFPFLGLSFAAFMLQAYRNWTPEILDLTLSRFGESHGVARVLERENFSC